MTTETDPDIFRPHPGTDAETFIQWKNTTLCMDFYCPCGAHGHYDGDFANVVRCPKCDASFELGTQVLARRTENDDRAVMLEVDDD